MCFLYFKTENRYVYSIVLVSYQEKSCPSVEGGNGKNSRVRDLCQQYLSVLQSLYTMYSGLLLQWSQHSCLPCHQKEKVELKSHLLRRKSNECLTSIEFHRGIIKSSLLILILPIGISPKAIHKKNHVKDQSVNTKHYPNFE